MKTLFVTFIGVLISISAISQDVKYRKDDRPQNIKEDNYNQYQVNGISEIDMLKALEIAGIRIFDIPFSPAFEKEYTFSIKLDEYVDSKKIDTKDILHPFLGKNIYSHYIDDTISQESVRYFDFVPKLTIFSKDNDTTLVLTISHLGGSAGGIKIKKNIVREWQNYYWRAYSKIDWKLNEEVPLLIYASSWYDERIKTDRFCGVVDLSTDEKKTKELLDYSPHYYVISLKVSE